MERHHLGACSPFMFGGEESEEMEFQTTPGAYFEAQRPQHISLDEPPYGEQNAYCEFSYIVEISMNLGAQY